MAISAQHREMKTANVARMRHPVILFHAKFIMLSLHAAGVIVRRVQGRRPDGTPLGERYEIERGKFYAPCFDGGEPKLHTRYARDWFAQRADRLCPWEYEGSFDWCYDTLQTAYSEGWVALSKFPALEDFRRQKLEEIDLAWDGARIAAGEAVQLRVPNFNLNFALAPGACVLPHQVWTRSLASAVDVMQLDLF